jgi:hypothetical protein
MDANKRKSETSNIRVYWRSFAVPCDEPRLLNPKQRSANTGILAART